MSDPSTPWISFVPRDLAEAILADARAGAPGHERHIQAATLFADVSGFTAMSEALAQIGKLGAEELTRAINGYFTPLIARIQQYGGTISAFGGDAMTALFPYDGSAPRAAARRAIQCALEMQAEAARHSLIATSAGDFSLTMKIGMALGRLLGTSAGDPAYYQEYIVAGSAIDRCAAAEHLARGGEVVAHRDLLRAAGDARAEPMGDGFARLRGLAAPAAPDPPPAPGRIPAAAAAAYARYLHPTIARRLETGISGLLNEHRRVSVLFVSFAGDDYDGDPQAGARLRAYIERVLQIVRRYDGYLNKIDMGDKGSKCLIVFGAPVAHEDDPERALRCAVEIQALGRAARIGVNSGFAYCGLVGSPSRHEYTVMGDAVNVAARLMQAAGPGEVLAGAATRRPVAQTFFWEPLAPMPLKGKAAPIEVFRSRGPRAAADRALAEPGPSLPLIGRGAELELSIARLDLAARGRGQVIGVIGEAGLGKSRLAAEILAAGEARGMAAFGGACQSFGSASPYLVWQPIWRGLLGLGADQPAAAQAAQLAERLVALDPALLPRMPLLGVVLGLSLPDSELTAGFDAQQRADLLRALLLTCLRLLSRDRPLLLLLEDVHWADPLSRELLAFLGRNLADLPVALAVMARPDGAAALDWGASAPHVCRIQLGELGPAQAAALIAARAELLFGPGALSAGPAAARIAARAGGNPYFIEELLNYIRDRQIDPRDQAAMAALDLPHSLHSLILSRIDRLGEQEQRTIKLASVIGRSFRAGWLWGCYPEIGTPAQTLASLDTLSRHDLTALDKPAPELEYLFKHIATQEVPYESMALSTREMLHGRVGDYIERLAPDSPGRSLDLLAFHYGRSSNRAKQRAYFRAAGDAARAAFANQPALDYYERLLPHLDTGERPAILCAMGEILQLVGRWDAAEARFHAALGLAVATGDPTAQAGCRVLLGHLTWSRGDYPAALGWLEQALAAYRELGDRAGMAQAHGYIGLVYSMQGEQRLALRHLGQQAGLAIAVGDRAGEAQALGHIGSIYQERGDFPAALTHYERQLAIARALGDRRSILSATGNIGIVRQWQGDYPAALARLGEVIALAAEIGDLQSLAVAAVNMGEVYRVAGSDAEALRCYRYGLGALVDLDDRAGITATIANIAQVEGGRGQIAQAAALIDAAISLAEALHIPFFLAHCRSCRAELLLARGDIAAATAENAAALRIAGEIELREIVLKASLRAIEFDLQAGRIGRDQALADCARLLDESADPAERAEIARCLWGLSGLDDYRTFAAEGYAELYRHTPSAEYLGRYRELGGVELPSPPPLAPPPPMIDDAPPLDALLARVAELG